MLTRRTLLAVSATGMAAPFVIPSAHAATPKGVIVMVKQIDDIISFDPAESYEFSNNEMDANCYRRLVRPDPTRGGVLSGDLAESWDVSPDGLTFTFRLRTDAKFATGRAVTADDVAFSLQRVVLLNKTPGFILTQFGFTRDNVEKMIRAVDEKTVQLQLPSVQATSFVLYCLSANVGSVIDKETVMSHATNGDMGNGWLKTTTAGAGPYKLTSWQASDSMIADANPHSGIKVGVRRIVVKHVAEPATQLLMLQKGDADIARDLTADQLRTILAKKELGVSSSGQATSMYIPMNQAMAELAKPEVRQAIKWAIDYDAIARNITPGTWSVDQYFLPKGIPGALTNQPFTQDLNKARALMKQAGLADGFTCTMDYISTSPVSDIAQAVQADLGKIGIKVNLLPGEQKQVITKTRARQHQLALLVWGSDYFDPNSNAQAFCENPDDSDSSKLKILAWRSHFRDAELTRMSQEAAKELDAGKRLDLYQQMQQLFVDRAPFAMLLQKNASAVSRKGVSGFVVGPLPDYTRYDAITKA
ncbi:MAG: ABC transporter substrate-binding protein [Acetobacteraceae bacterium]